MMNQNPGFLTRLLGKWPSQSTVIGKSVLPVLLLVRLVLLGAARQTAWADENEFVCNTGMPGCEVVCYDSLTPLAPPRFWTLQLVLVLALGLVFLCYLIHLTMQETEMRRGDAEVKGHALGVYKTCMASVILVEVSSQCRLFSSSRRAEDGLPLSYVYYILRFSTAELAGDDLCAGKTVLPVLQLIRVVIVGAAVQPVWDREFKDFVCNSQQPGCSHAAFNYLFPYSLHQYWTLQVVLVLASGLIFCCYLVSVIIEGNKQGPGVQVKGHVLGAYLVLLSAGVLLEVGFAVFQTLTFGFHLSSNYNIGVLPCPSRVDCHVPQASEKMVFMCIMFAVGCLSALLTLIELCAVLTRERPWAKSQNTKILEMSDAQMGSTVSEEGDTTEINESCSKLNI